MDNNKTIVIQPKSAPDLEEKNDLQGIVEFFYLCISKWKWFVISLVSCMIIGFLYLKITPPKYTRSASVHIKEDSRQGSIGNISDEFASLGIGSTNGSVNNEVVAFNSLELAEQVVKELALNITYKTDNGLRKDILFGKTLPVRAFFFGLDDEETVSLTLELQESGKIRLYDLKHNGEKIAFETETVFGETVSTPVCRIVLAGNEMGSAAAESQKIYVSRAKLSTTTFLVHKRLVAVQNNNKNSVIDITYTDENAERAEAIINTTISEYNGNWLKDKNELGILTSKFIDERIKAIQQELGGVDSEIASYKSANLITDPTQAISILLAQASQSDQQVMGLSNQVNMCKYLHEYVADETNAQKMIPANIGVEAAEVNSLIEVYNQKMLTRNTYANNSSEKNPMVQNLDEELQAQRSVILQSLDNEMKHLESQIDYSKKTIRESTSKLSNSPIQEKNILSMDRQQKVKESLYLFLLQKREENELSQAFSAYNTRVISRPMGLLTPTSPVPMRVYLVVIIAALFLPIIILFIRELLYTKVRGRADVDKLTIPFLGEIPQQNKSKKRNHKKKKEDTGLSDLVVEKANRNIMNEAFRVVRSNLNFMLRPHTSSKRQVILITSATPYSGKTFISLNLALAYSFSKDTKVAIIDMDIRKAQLSKHVDSPKNGLTEYLGCFHDDWHSLLHQIGDNGGVDILPVGHIPPNPSELLQSDRLQTLLEEMKQEYDIIFLDMPPAEAVADVTIVKHLADITLYVIRVGVTERSMLSIVERYNKENTFNNMAIVLNGSELQQRRYGYGGYGYGYGGYGYGYGYDYGD